MSIAVSLECLLVAPLWVERLVGLLHAFIRNIGDPDDAPMRVFACSCLEELELAYPGDARDNCRGETARALEGPPSLYRDSER